MPEAMDVAESDGTGGAAAARASSDEDISASGTEAVTTQYRKMSVSDAAPADATLSSADALPELPVSRTDVACLLSSPDDSLRMGDAAAAEGNYVDAIKFYTHALTPSETSVETLCKRARAMIQFANHTRERSASQVDEDIVAGPDAETLAMMALRDVKKILSLDATCATAFLYKGRALCVLEEYEDAAEALQAGLSLNMQHPELLAELKKLKALRDLATAAPQQAVAADPSAVEDLALASDGRAVKRARGSLGSTAGEQGQENAGALPEDDFRCPLCVKLLYEPVTTPCGHTFCRGCLMRSLDHTNRCPMCRTVLHTSARKHPISVSLQSILSKHFPAETAERRDESTEEVNHGPCVLPLFVVDYVLPGQALALNVFEPRYRLMIRRCLDGDRRFGMLGGVQPMPAGMKEFGCEVEIQDSRQLHDGRYHIQVRVVRRFWIVQKWDLDGYHVARVTFFSDDDPADHEAAAETELSAGAGGDKAGGSGATDGTQPTAETPATHSAAAAASPSGAGGDETATDQGASLKRKVGGGGGGGGFGGGGSQAAMVYSAQLRQMARNVQITVKEWLVRAKSLSKHSTKMSLLFRQLVARAGRPPTDPYRDLELYSFWVGNILPTSTRDRQEMIQARSTRGRMIILIRLMMETIEQTKLSEDDGVLELAGGGSGDIRGGGTGGAGDTGGGGGPQSSSDTSPAGGDAPAEGGGRGGGGDAGGGAGGPSDGAGGAGDEGGADGAGATVQFPG